MSKSDEQTPGNTLFEFEPILDRFEADWRSGQRPDLNQYLEMVPEASRPGLFSELLSLDLDYRREAGETPKASHYLVRCPQFAEQIRHCIAATATPKPRAVASLKIRCPHCHNPVELVNDDPSGDVSCPSCGSCFNLCVKFAEALHHAHEAGVVHRDLKPQNILVRRAPARSAPFMGARIIAPMNRGITSGGLVLVVT